MLHRRVYRCDLTHCNAHCGVTSFEHVRYASVVVEAAHSLAERYNAKVGMTRSWGAIDDETKFEVIIDNLMNLELLWWASVRYVTLSLRYFHWQY